jgi:hypothetical protein
MTRSPLHARRVRGFGNGRPYIAPAVRRRRAINRIWAVLLGGGGMVALLMAYLVMGTAALTPSPQTAAFLALMLGLSGFGLIVVGIVAAMEG